MLPMSAIAPFELAAASYQSQASAAISLASLGPFARAWPPTSLRELGLIYSGQEAPANGLPVNGVRSGARKHPFLDSDPQWDTEKAHGYYREVQNAWIRDQVPADSDRLCRVEGMADNAVSAVCAESSMRCHDPEVASERDKANERERYADDTDAAPNQRERSGRVCREKGEGHPRRGRQYPIARPEGRLRGPSAYQREAEQEGVIGCKRQRCEHAIFKDAQPVHIDEQSEASDKHDVDCNASAAAPRRVCRGCRRQSITTSEV